MATEFQMPKLGLTMEQATILEWLVADGAPVEKGTPVISIETDKTETEVECIATGILHRVGKVGDVFACGEVIGYVLAEGEALPAPPAAKAPAATAAAAPVARPAVGVTGPAPVATAPTMIGGRILASPNARRLAGERGIDLRFVRGTGPDGAIVSADLDGTTAPDLSMDTIRSANQYAVATIAARDLANLLGVDLAAVHADPIEGRITRDTVAFYVRQRLAAGVPSPTPAAAAPAAAPNAPAPAPAAALLQSPTKTIRMSGMRGTIAKRMHASLQEMAQLTLAMDADMSAVIADRNARKANGAAPGFTDYVVAAAAKALALHPNVNAQVSADGIALLPEIHVGLAVAVDNGLLVPVVKNANELALEDLSAETTRLAAGARAGTLAPGDLEGGTFSVTALGMFGVDMFTPVINPPNVAILGVGRIREELILVNGQVGTTQRLTLSLTWDHRVIDGAPAAEFCKTVADLLASPERLA